MLLVVLSLKSLMFRVPQNGYHEEKLIPLIEIIQLTTQVKINTIQPSLTIRICGVHRKSDIQNSEEGKKFWSYTRARHILSWGEHPLMKMPELLKVLSIQWKGEMNCSNCFRRDRLARLTNKVSVVMILGMENEKNDCYSHCQNFHHTSRPDLKIPLRQFHGMHKHQRNWRYSCTGWRRIPRLDSFSAPKPVVMK